MSITQSQYWNSEYNNFNATSEEAKQFLSSVELTEENKDIKILNNFYKEENQNVGKYRNDWEAKENQWVYLPNIITFEEFKKDQAKKEEEIKKQKELAKTIKVGDRIELYGKYGTYYKTIGKIIEGVIVETTDGGKYECYIDIYNVLCGRYTR